MALSRSARITLLLAIDVVFFFVELIVGYAVGSLALVADSFHMLNDVMSLIVALYAIKLTANSSADSRYSYGWHRAEILAALINGVFLLALCFSISLEAIERFFSTPLEISNPKLVVVVGSLGLASNLLGLFLFHEHAHSHDHSHGKASSSRPESITGTSSPVKSAPQTSGSISPSHDNLDQNLSSGASDPALEDDLSPATISTEYTPLLQPRPKTGHSHNHSHSHGSMNMRALVLHVLGDALGNVGVIATGLVIWLTQWSFKFYFDPVISLVITVIIFSSALPLVRSASFILLQGVPPTISLDGVRESILEVDGVLSVHELHVWQLSESKVIASVHVLTSRNHDFMPIAVKIREALHHHGIHSSTIQPEYHCPGTESTQAQAKCKGGTSCLILCPSDQACDPTENACCREY
ncbi:Zinc/cadmium resistance protein [Termitomyces sp. J132]|nr:Zinc/cadmium resistance protein [Termitomyces sp. J132]